MDQYTEDKMLEYAMDLGAYCEDCHTWKNACTECDNCETCGTAPREK